MSHGVIKCLLSVLWRFFLSFKCSWAPLLSTSLNLCSMSTYHCSLSQLAFPPLSEYTRMKAPYTCTPWASLLTGVAVLLWSRRGRGMGKDNKAGSCQTKHNAKQKKTCRWQSAFASLRDFTIKCLFFFLVIFLLHGNSKQRGFSCKSCAVFADS